MNTLRSHSLSSLYRTLGLVVLTASLSSALTSESGLAVWLLLLLPLVLAGAYFERVTFDGDRVWRTGLMARLERLTSGQSLSLKVEDIEMVTTEAIRSRRGLKRVKYSYRVLLTGQAVSIVILFKGGRSTATALLLRELLNALDEHRLDPRSQELKEYLRQQPSREMERFRLHTDLDKVDEDSYSNLSTERLRSVANELKLEGFLQQAFQCFSFAYKREPRNPQLLYEMARFFRSLGTLHHPRLLSRSAACLRLAAFLAKDRPQLLERIGETYFERSEYSRAAKCFTKALEADPTLFRANVGLAEIALRDGRLAHVVYFYSTAASVSLNSSQRRLAQREADYYNRLCSDEDYFEVELERMTKLSNFKWARNCSGVLLFFFWILAIFSGFFSPAFSGLAWSAVFSTTLVWIGSAFFAFRYSQRNG